MKYNPVIAGMLPGEWEQALADSGIAGYRAAQVREWVFRRQEFSFAAMANVPAALRAAFAERYRCVALQPEERARAQDGTMKYLFRTADGAAVESVLIRAARRQTVCVSTQVGCAYACALCATGQAGFERDLSAAEIVSQLLWIQKEARPAPVTHVVYMGMGEPLANYTQTVRSVRILNHPDCGGLGARRITISTCGLPAEIERLADEAVPCELSVSLHAAEDALRSRMMPVNRRYPLAGLMAACRRFTQKTKRIVTFEYVVAGGVNDQPEHARALGKLLGGFDCKVNVLTCNPVAGSGFTAPSAAQVRRFSEMVAAQRIKVTLRVSRGADIAGACGQLRALRDHNGSG
ncbi:MAG: 23S rRNA (adenine(2503)-C(2))-methyltransferase RlmN [Candidatus Omnitrophica bacterium]|nr:23S rRNA (adenine(2503)-C(2))-methyltransferase RlmN [Candidatus Omnitrophota bacterium]